MAQLQWLWYVVIAIPVNLCLQQKTGKIAESRNFYAGNHLKPNT